MTNSCAWALFSPNKQKRGLSTYTALVFILQEKCISSGLHACTGETQIESNQASCKETVRMYRNTK